MDDLLYLSLNPSIQPCLDLSPTELTALLEKLNASSVVLLDFFDSKTDEETALDAIEQTGVNMDYWISTAHSNLDYHFGHE